MDLFMDCTSLKSVDLSNFNTPMLTTCSEMFSGCTSLTTIDISNFKPGPYFRQTYDMFRDCHNLTTIYCNNDLVEGVDLDYGNPGDLVGNMFLGCNKLVGGNGTKYAEDPSKLDIYYAHPDEPNNPGYFTKSGSTKPTGIENGVPFGFAEKDAWFSLDGRVLNSEPTQTGLYIRNGKKVILK